ncbi:hypothetical protein [Aneurinibacillus tyrosinisolvens]|nr:hypothetical protein [Aneurinibacillus tyrosinisolvens]
MGNPYQYAILVSLFWKWAGIQMPEMINGFIDLAVKTRLPITLFGFM